LTSYTLKTLFSLSAYGKEVPCV